MQSPAWHLFRADLKRRWRGGSAPAALGAFLAVLAVQALCTFAASQLAGRFGTQAASWLLAGLSALGLLLPFPGTAPAATAIPGLQLYYLVAGLLAIPGAAARFLLPAHAAGSIATDRRERRIQELVLAGLRPGPILLAKGCAALLPLLILLLAGWAVAASAYLYGAAAGWAQRGAPDALGVYRSLPDFGWLALLAVAGFLPNALLDAAILVCISALCRRPQTATAVCYVVQLGGYTLLAHLAYFASSTLWAYDPTAALMSAWLIAFVLKLALLTLLLRRALSALAYPDEERGGFAGAEPLGLSG